MKQTPVQQLINNLETLLDYKVTGEIEQDKPVFEMFQQALEMEKQLIIDAYVFGFKECEKIHEEAFFIQDLSEKYYNETYKPEAKL